MTQQSSPLVSVARAGRSDDRRKRIFAVVASVATVTAMVALTFAAVPLYRLFCQVTGFSGTTQVATTAPGATAAPPIAVRFDANVAPGLPWRFVAPSTVQARQGEERLVFFVDPAILKDNDGRGVAEITLSYTFFNKGAAARDEYIRSHQASTAAVREDRR